MNEQLTLDIYHREDEVVQVGDVVATTTSEFDYNGLTHCFDREAKSYTECVVVKIGEDYSEYVPEKSCNGGCYGFDFYRVVEINQRCYE